MDVRTDRVGVLLDQLADEFVHHTAEIALMRDLYSRRDGLARATPGEE